MRATRSNLGRAELDCRTAFAMTNKKLQIEGVKLKNLVAAVIVIKPVPSLSTSHVLFEPLLRVL